MSERLKMELTKLGYGDSATWGGAVPYPEIETPDFTDEAREEIECDLASGEVGAIYYHAEDKMKFVDMILARIINGEKLSNLTEFEIARFEKECRLAKEFAIERLANEKAGLK